MRIKFGPDEGNRTAVIRWGKHLDNGLWLGGLSRHKKWLFKRYDHGGWEIRTPAFCFCFLWRPLADTQEGA